MSAASHSRPADLQPFDVIVIGGGIAGWTAARRSQGLGARVALLERAASGPGWSNSRVSGGRIHASYLNPLTESPERLFEQLMKKTDGHARPDIARAWAENTGRAMHFLIEQGAHLEALNDLSYLQASLAPVPGRTIDPFATWRDSGPDRLLITLWRAFMRDGGTFRPALRARELDMRDGAVAGVYVEHADGLRELVAGRAVIMADGGFQANRELMRKYGVIQHAYRLLGSPYDVGDCLLMSLAVGGQAVEMDSFYGSTGLRDAITNERLRTAPSPDELIDSSMVVNTLGARIGDEAIGSEPGGIIQFKLANPIAKAAGDGDPWVIFDHTVWETVGRSDALIRANAAPGGVTLNPFYVDNGGTFVSAESIADLAARTDIDANGLQRSVDAFNAFARGGAPVDPPRSQPGRPIIDAPFHAIPLGIGLMFTMGGLLVNGHGQVLDQQNEPIRGLYAAGGTMGGLDGGPRNGYAGGWSCASTFGLLAAEHAVAQVGSPQLVGER